ncbi:MAG: barstar family protein [Solobacterium sp.]|nr:barstar family protein [Solobacterium sp.]
MSLRIELDAKDIENRHKMYTFFREKITVPEYFGANLDALYDVLSEYDEDVSFIFTRENTRRITREEYAWKVVMIIARCMQENPHIHMVFCE